jgi:hypothetical protein
VAEGLGIGFSETELFLFSAVSIMVLVPTWQLVRCVVPLIYLRYGGRNVKLIIHSYVMLITKAWT